MKNHGYTFPPGQIVIEGCLYDVSRAKLGEAYKHYLICANCDKLHKYHTEEQCPFEATTFLAKTAVVGK